jgi:hypothetical protein
MHGSGRGIKAFHGKLSIIEAVDLKFTSASKAITTETFQRFSNFALPKVLVPLEAAFQPILG